MMQVQLFSYRNAGTFTRPSMAWYSLDNGEIRGAAADGRRIILRGDVPRAWIYIEGARQNIEPNPTDLSLWSSPASSPTSVQLPDGTTGNAWQIDSADTVADTFSSAAQPIRVASIFAMGTTPGQEFTVNVSPGAASDFSQQIETVWWTRILRRAPSSASGAQQIRIADLDGSNSAIVWGAGVEVTPGSPPTAAPFASEPILTTGVRAAELFAAGHVAATQVTKTIRLWFSPDFSTSDVVSGQVFTLFAMSVASSFSEATDIGMWLVATADGVLQLRAGTLTGPATTGNVALGRGLAYEIVWHLDTGILSLDDNNFTGPAATMVPATLYVGCRPGGGQEAFALLGPLLFEYPNVYASKLDQLTRNSAALLFADGSGNPVSVRQESAIGASDALNPDNYTVLEAAGPRVQYIAPGDLPSEVVVYFDRVIEPGEVVTVQVARVVSAGDVPVPVYDGERAICRVSTPNYLGVYELAAAGDGSAARIEFALWEDPLPLPGAEGVEILDARPLSPHVRVSYINREDSLTIERVIREHAGHLIRLVIPSPRFFLIDEDSQDAAFVGGSAVTWPSFAGFGAAVNTSSPEQATVGRVDLANPQTSSDAAQGATLGTLQYTETGDLATERGRAYLRKRIFRRLSTARSGFTHLPTYGLALPSKQLLTPTTLRRLQKDVESQIMQEPDVRSVRATITDLGKGVVRMDLAVQDDFGAFDMSLQTDLTNG